MSDAARARKFSQPVRAIEPQPFASLRLASDHEDALHGFGELGLFTLMWRPEDFTEGRVGRCPVCFGGNTSRQAEAFQQPIRRECPNCFGTTFNGGFRAQIIRPMIMADRQDNTVERESGVVTGDTIQFETTSDFEFNVGDYVFRADGNRYQCEQKAEVVVRTGFAFPTRAESLSGLAIAHLEERTTVAHKIPPVSEVALRERLLLRPGVMPDLSEFDDLAPNGYLIEP